MTKVLISSINSSSVITDSETFSWFFILYFKSNSTILFWPFFFSCELSSDKVSSYLFTQLFRLALMSLLRETNSRSNFLQPLLYNFYPKSRRRGSTTVPIAMTLSFRIASVISIPWTWSLKDYIPRNPEMTMDEVYLVIISQKSTFILDRPFLILTLTPFFQNYANIRSDIYTILGMWSTMKSKLNTCDRIFLLCFHPSFYVHTIPFRRMEQQVQKMPRTFCWFIILSGLVRSLMSSGFLKLTPTLLRALPTVASYLMGSFLSWKKGSPLSLDICSISSIQGEPSGEQGYTLT